MYLCPSTATRLLQGLHLHDFLAFCHSCYRVWSFCIINYWFNYLVFWIYLFVHVAIYWNYFHLSLQFIRVYRELCVQNSKRPQGSITSSSDYKKFIFCQGLHFICCLLMFRSLFKCHMWCFMLLSILKLWVRFWLNLEPSWGTCKAL